MKVTTRPALMLGALGVALVLSLAILHAQIPQQDCGNEGDPPCQISVFNAVCDTGLRLSLPRVCGCILHGPFGGCLIPKLCLFCVNYTRRQPGLDGFSSTWLDWALRNP